MADSKTRFSFTKTLDYALIHSVALNNKHVAPRDEKKEKWAAKLPMFMASLDVIQWIQVRGCSTAQERTLPNRFDKLVKERRAQLRLSASASCSSEEHGEFEKMLDDIISEMDDKK